MICKRFTKRIRVKETGKRRQGNIERLFGYITVKDLQRG
jgi:hypothetical protein